MDNNINYFFSPKNVAVIGASREFRKFGHMVFENFVEKFPGNVYPVNPNAGNVMGRNAYKNVKDIPAEVDLAIIVVPAAVAVQAVADCVSKGVKAVVILSGGFREVGREDLEEQIKSITANTPTRIIGPNCIGIYDAYSDVDTLFNPLYKQARPEKGKIAFISQSGAFGAAMLDWLAAEGIGLSKFMSVGNKLDIDESDLLEYLAEDDKTKAICMYIEGAKNGRKLYDSIKKITKKKPVIVFKAGKTDEGANAATSHTGSMAGAAAIYTGMFKQAGALEVSNIEGLFDIAKVLVLQHLPKGDRVQIITNAGGFGVVMTDEVSKHGLTLAAMTEETRQQIKNFVPDYAVIGNPIDLIGDANSERYEKTVGCVLADPNVDAVLITILLQVSTLESDIADVLVSLKEQYQKPMVICSTGGDFTRIHTRMLEREGIPTYPTPERAVKAMKALIDYSRTNNSS